jgi:RNA polymerase sigma-70 factor (ECF subfamily)
MQTRSDIKVSMSQTDEELLAAYKASGELEILAILYKRYMGLVFAVCLKYLKTQPASEDAVMDIFEQLIEKVKRYDIEHFRPWLGTLARNHCLMQLRKKKAIDGETLRLEADFMHSAKLWHPNSGDFGVGDLATTEAEEKEFILTSMESCLDTLVAQQKTCVSLFYLEQKCYKEVAEITGFAIDKVRSYIQNGRRNLKICMEKKVSDQ